MVAELLRLRLRILANGFRRRPLQVAAIVFAILLGIAGVVAFWAGARWVSQFEDHFILAATTTVGAWLSIAALLVPIMVIRRPVLSARAFLGYPLSPFAVGLTMFAYALIGPGILLIPMAIAPVEAWPHEASRQLAWAAAPLIFLQTLATIALARRIGMALRRHQTIAVWVELVSVAVLVGGAATIVGVIAPRVPSLLDLVKALAPFNDLFRRAPEVLAQTPFGALWAAPGLAAPRFGEPDEAWRIIGLSALLVVALLVVWFAVVGLELRPTHRLPGPRRTRVPGWFGRVPASPAGAVAARSFSYWLRDPRYRTVFAVLPLILGFALLALTTGGVPFSIAVLVPLPVMTLLLAWATVHNDVAYDNTAVWQHVAAQTRGVDDRGGRSAPVLVWGVLLLAAGIPLTAWGYGDISIALPLGGVCAALLLGGIGVGNLYSARFPYAAPRPGDPAWQAPQVATSQGGVAQGISLLFVLLVALPALVASALWWIAGGPWGWLALGAGVLCGAAVFAAGIRGGGRMFDAHAPELLAFTQRN